MVWVFCLTFLSFLTVATPQDCYHNLIWQNDFCVSQNDLSSNILPPNNTQCRIRLNSFIRLIQTNTTNITTLYQVPSEEEMRNCDYSNNIQSTQLSEVSLFRLTRGIYYFGENYYFFSPVGNTCLQLAFNVVSEFAVTTCSLKPVCSESVLNDTTQEFLGCGVAMTTQLTPNIPNTTTTTTTTIQNLSTTASTRSTTPAETSFQFNITLTVLILVGAFLLILIVITGVLITFACIYCIFLTRKNKKAESKDLENKQAHGKKTITKSDISVIVRDEEPPPLYPRIGSCMPRKISPLNSDAKVLHHLQYLVESRHKNNIYLNHPSAEISCL